MKPEDFVHLHVHTEYSTLDGINKINSLPTYAKEELGQNALAITDHGNISGSYKFVKECRNVGIKPIVGMEAYYTVGDRTAREKDELEKAFYHMILLAADNTGLHNLIKLSSHAYTEGFYHKPRLDDALIADYSEGIYATSACLGSRSSQLILKGRKKEARSLIEHHAEMFKDRFLLEVQLHDGPEQRLVNAALIETAKETGLPLVLTNDCHYTHEEDKEMQRILLAMQTKGNIHDANAFANAFQDIIVHVADHDWMWKRAQAHGIPYEAISNTKYIRDLVNSDSYFIDRRNRYPKFEGLPEGMTSWTALERLTKQLLFNKMGGMPNQEYKDRIDYELDIIKKMGFYDYLLIVWEFCEGARSEGVWLGAGRGSAAGSLVAYALDITDVDPIKYGLVFERWLNYGRAATPLLLDQSMKNTIDELSSRPEPVAPFGVNLTSCFEHGHTKEHNHG